MIRFCKPARIILAIFSLTSAFMTVGCGSGTTQARLLNAMDGQSSVNMIVNNSTVSSGVAFGTASSYSSTSSGSQSVQIQASGTTLLNQTLTLSGGNNNTVLATDAGLTAFTDNKSTPASGDIQVRIINASSTLGATDVYIITPGTDISTMNATVSDLGFQAASSYQTVAAGSYQVEFTQTGSKNVIFATTSSSFSAGQIRTVVALDSPSGGFTTAVLSDLN